MLVIMGFGVGMVMPNLMTAIQNAVPLSELGSATASATFLRSLGGALGVALSGAVLTAHLRPVFAGPKSGEGVAQIARLVGAERAAVFDAYRAGLTGAFAAGMAVAGLGLIIVLLLPELPLRITARDTPLKPQKWAVSESD
jgi:hypothetical protein